MKKKQPVENKTYYPKYSKIPTPKVKKVDVEIVSMIRKTSGGNYAWYNSNVGKIRKEII